MPSARSGRDGLPQTLVGQLENRRRLCVAVIGNHNPARVEVGRVETPPPQRLGDHKTGHPLAVARDGVYGERTQLSQDRKSVNELGQLPEVAAEKILQLAHRVRGSQLLRLADQVVAKLLGKPPGFGSPPLDGSLGNLQQAVGRLAHGRDDDHDLGVLLETDDVGYFLDSRGALQRAAAEFHDDHGVFKVNFRVKAQPRSTNTRALVRPDALRERQENPDGSPLADLAFHFDLSIVIVDNALND